MQQTSLAFAQDDLPLPAPSGNARTDLSLRKATGAIHIRNDISTLQRKVINALLCTAGAQLADRTILSHQVALSYLCQLTGFRSNNVAHIKDSIESLVGTRIKWDIIDPDGAHEWGVAALLADARIRGGVVTYSFAPALREKLATPEHWALLRMPVIRRFASGPGLAMYENCIPYRSVGQTPYFGVEMLRELLGATAESYDEFKSFNRAILKPAIAEVNKVGKQHNDIQVELEYKRVKRQVTEVKIWITSSGEEADGVAVDERLLDQLTEDFCLVRKKAFDILVANEPEKVTAVMNYVGARYTQGKVAHGKIAPYFLSTLAKWDGSAEPQVSRLDHTPTAMAGADKGFGEARQKSLKAAAERQEAERLAEERKIEAFRRLSALDVDQRVTLDAQFEENVAKHQSFVLPYLKKHGPDHPMIRGLYSAFIQHALLDEAVAA